MPLDSTQGMSVLRDYVNNIIPSKVEATTKEIAAYALERALYFSPYVTGTFLASWRVVVDENQLGEGATPGQRSYVEAQQESRSASESTISALKFGTTFYIGNGAKYAQYVEYGSPTSQPYYITRRVAQSIGGKFGRIDV